MRQKFVIPSPDYDILTKIFKHQIKALYNKLNILNKTAKRPIIQKNIYYDFKTRIHFERLSLYFPPINSKMNSLQGSPGNL